MNTVKAMKRWPEMTTEDLDARKDKY